MESVTLAERLGTTAHLSALLMKARRLGLGDPRDLERLAVSRGLRYYDSHGDSFNAESPSTVPEAGIEVGLTNEELAIALLSPAAPYSPQRLRMGAAMLAAEGNQPENLARLALMERCETVVRHIAACGHEVEPGNPFWSRLIELLPAEHSAPRPDTLPHPTRFVAMTGITRNGVGHLKQWIRPRVQRFS
jgi:antitoxin (DNA-binding transcriptional repressor) of toxin-antitoxin stability system